jgi:Spy/CpxP family protein refolding chaperone
MKSTRVRDRLILAFAAVLLVASSASAQGFKWWNSEHYKHELGLTADQSRRLEEIFQAALPDLRAHKKTLDAAEAKFNRLVQDSDEKAVLDQVNRVESARADLNKARTLMLLRMRRTLTTDQWVKLGALHDAAERERQSAGGTHDQHDHK